MLVHMDVRSVLSTIFRQIWKFLLVFIPITLIGIIYILGATRLYQSDSKLLVKFGQDARPEVSIDSRFQGGMSAEEKRGLVQSNLNILSSRDLAEALLGEITIEKVYPKIAKLNISDEAKMNAAVKTFQHNLVANTESDAGIIAVGVLNPDPEIAHILLRNLVNLFLEKQSEVFGNPQLDVLREQAETSKQKLEKSAQDLYDFKTKTGIASIDEELTLLLQQRGDLAGYMSRRTIQQDTNDLEGEISTSEQEYENPPVDEAVVSEDALPEVKKSQTQKYEALPVRISKSGDTSRLPVVEDTQKKIDELKSREAQLLLTYRPDSRIIKNLRKNIEVETAALEEAVQALNDQIADLDYQIAQKQEHRGAYDTLTRQVSLSTEAYNTAQSRLQAAEVNNDLNLRKITRISVIEEPTLPVKPSKPNKMIVLVLCLLCGVAFGGALGLGTELLDATFTRPEQLQAEIKKPVLASFSNWFVKSVKPLPPRTEWKGSVQKLIKDKAIPTIFESRTVREKSLDEKDLLALYQSVVSSLPDKKSRVVNISSSYVGEGSTTISYELARFANEKLGQSVLFVGHENFSPKDRNLATPLCPFSILDSAQGRSSIKDSIVTMNDAHSPFAFGYLSKNDRYENIITSADKISALFEQLRSSFSLIIVPTPGVISNSAGVTIAKISDGVVFVVEAEKTRAPVVKQAIDNITEKGGNLIGTVLNKQIHYIPSWLYQRL